MSVRLPKIENSGLDPDLFCVTDSVNVASEFRARRKGGIIAIFNDDVARLNQNLIEINSGESSDRDGFLRNFKNFVLGITKGTEKSSTVSLHQPHQRYGYDDPPHTHSEVVALLYADQRPSEINNGQLVRSDGFYPRKDNNSPEETLMREEMWGIGDNEKKHVYAPFSFRPEFLVILLYYQKYLGIDYSPLHRIPRRLNGQKPRRNIAILQHP